jgi:hypothetical protein
MLASMTDDAEPIIRKSTPGHGGHRPGAGRKPKTDQADAYTILAKAKAKRETYRAQMEELRYNEAAGKLVAIDEFERVFASAIKMIAVTLESLPDVLERDAGINGAAVERCQAVIDQVREDLYHRIQHERFR